MSFRELRNFTEMMRALGYIRPISVENFRTPNFELVADALFWMAKKYDPHMNITEEIDTEEDRIEFLASICSALLSKARIKLNAKKLYAGDGYAVKELLKVATVLYDASRIEIISAADNNTDDSGHSASDSSKKLRESLKDTKATRALSTEITDKGAKLFDLLDSELKIKSTRDKAIEFLDAVSTNLDTTSEHKYLEKSIKNKIQELKSSVSSMNSQAEELAADENALSAKITKKKQDLERNEKRLKSLKTVRPAFMDEYERLEQELEAQYKVYCERYRNLDYLEYELDVYNRHEKEVMKEKDRSLNRLQKKLREEELRILRGESENNLEFSMDDTMTKGGKKSKVVVTTSSDDSGASSSSGASSAISDDDDDDSSSNNSSEEDGHVSLGDDDDDDSENLIDHDDDGSSSSASSSEAGSSDSMSDSDRDF